MENPTNPNLTSFYLSSTPISSIPESRVRMALRKFSTYGMPKYYRKKILGDALRSALANYVQSEHVRVYQEKFRQVSADHPCWTDFQVSDFLDSEEKTQLLARINNQVKSVKRYLENPVSDHYSK